MFKNMTWLKELIKPKTVKSDDFLKKPKLTKIEGYTHKLSFNETFSHIHKQIKQ
jgi:hypothetical protein